MNLHPGAILFFVGTIDDDARQVIAVDDTGLLPFNPYLVGAIADLLARAITEQHDYTKNDNAETDSAMTAEVVDELRAAERALATVKQLLGGA